MSPIGIVVKSADVLRAKAICNINVSNSATLRLANTSLLEQGYPKIKVRLTHDLSASGVNGEEACYCPSFDYPPLDSLLSAIAGNDPLRPNRYLAKGDVAGYFNLFPLANEIKHLYVFEWKGQYFQYDFVNFGGSPNPYFCSSWSAEFASWLKCSSINAHPIYFSFYVDDWCCAGSSLSDADAQIHFIADLFASFGAPFGVDKFESGPRLSFLGIVFDLPRNIVTIDQTQAAGYLLQLKSYHSILSQRRKLDLHTLQHLNGKLNWFCGVLQSGRIYLSDLWDLYLNPSHPPTIDKAISSLTWWITTLKRWEVKEVAYSSIRLIDLSTGGHSIVQSDASGTDGYGYVYWSSDHKLSTKWVSKRWKSVDAITNGQSHKAELYALYDYLVNVDSTAPLVCWISDSQSAVYSINKGTCRNPLAKPLLKRIFAVADSTGRQVVALWIPREQNKFPDLLSHLSTYLNRDIGGILDH